MTTTIGTGEYRTSDKPREVKRKLVSTGQMVALRGAEVDGQVLYEGDIVLSRNLEVLGIGISGGYRWPKRTLIYEIARDVDRALVERAIEHFREKNTVMKFARRVNEKDYVVFRGNDGCSSEVGMVGGRQFIDLGGCGFGTVVHEMCHAIGMWHEQGREDRDTYVDVHWDNIDVVKFPNCKDNFNQHIADGDDIGPYDYGSIMHYKPDAFAKDPSKPTITAKNGAQIGQRNGLSQGDIDSIAEMYKNVPP